MRNRKQIEASFHPIIISLMKRYRAKYGLSQEAFARTLKMSARSYSDLERGITFPSGLTFALFMTMLDSAEQKEALDELTGNSALM